MNFVSTDKLSRFLDKLGGKFAPLSRKINGKELSSDITLTASDVGALPSSTTIPSKTSQLTNDSEFAYTGSANTYNGEQKFQHSTYCPTAVDNANGVGCAYKASRGAVNQEIVGEIIMPYTTATDSTAGISNEAGKIKVEYISTVSSAANPTKVVEGYFEKGKGWVGKVNGLDIQNFDGGDF